MMNNTITQVRPGVWTLTPTRPEPAVLLDGLQILPGDLDYWGLGDPPWDIVIDDRPLRPLEGW